MASIKYSLSAQRAHQGKSEVMIRFIGGRDKTFRAHTKIFVNPARWKDNEVLLPKFSSEDYKELKHIKTQLDELKDYLLEAFFSDKASATNKDWLIDRIDEFHNPRCKTKLGFWDLFDAFIDSKDVSNSRKKRYSVVKRTLQRFEKYRKAKLNIDELSARDLEQFRKFLFDEYKICNRREYQSIYALEPALPKERSKNVVLEYHKVLRAFVHWSVKNEYTDNNPYKNFEIGSEVYGTPYYLTSAERDKIYECKMTSPQMEIQRDIFVFQCLVGCRVGDLLSFKKVDVQNGILAYIPRKTKDGHPIVVRVPLTETAREIVEKYAWIDGDRLLPCISPQKYNEAIKRILTKADITRIVTILNPKTRQAEQIPINEIGSSHLARRTFIGNLYKSIKDPAIISSMSGHADGSRAFARYRAIDDETKAEAIRILERKDL